MFIIGFQTAGSVFTVCERSIGMLNWMLILTGAKYG